MASILTDKIKIAQGHNNAAGLAAFTLEPWLPRIIPGIYSVSLSEVVFEDANRSADLIWGPKVPNSIKVSVLSACGLTSAVYATVTARLPSNKNRTTYSNYNAVAWYDEEDEFERRGSGFRIRLLFLRGI